ncbi:MAG: DUF58 domain-containing protein [Armatimonadetes bacterium]|nr:DUF58 domain-containing protein [Armatimonadota bacterium]
MTRLVTIALSVAGMFLIVMAVLVNSPPLFYMTVAVFATLGASRLQAWLAVRGLRFERFAPPTVSIGEPVTVETIVWSERRLKRPLVSVEDVLPAGLAVVERRPALPVAPSFEQPIMTRFSFRPMRRGRFSWRNLVVKGTDALGLVTLEKAYSAEPVQLTVCPVPLPVSVDIRPAAGWGLADLDSGLVRGSGIDPRGIREFGYGDEQRHIHWRSSARLGRLMVKEFDTGSGLNLAFVFQQTRASDIGPPGASTFEAMCGHALYLAERYLEKGASVWFPGLEEESAAQAHTEVRIRKVRDVLTDVQADKPSAISDSLRSIRYREGATYVLMLSVQDPNLPATILSLAPAHFVCLVYDAKTYDPMTRAKSATEPAFVAELEAAGATVQLMPHVEAAS